MPAHWVVTPDETLLDRLADALNSGGAVLRGPVGVGKTELAKEAAARFTGADQLHVAGTASARMVPFGAFAHVIDVADDGKASALLRAARDSLARHAGEEMLLVVDDAHLLDKLSASLVYQLAESKSARLLVTVDSAKPAPEAVSALWRDGLLALVEVAPLDRERTAAVLQAASAHTPDPGVIDAVFAASGGNPLYLRHVVGLQPAAHLTTLVTGYVASLPEAARAVLQVLAVQDPLTIDDVTALAGLDAVGQAEAAGAILVEQLGDNRLVRPAHPLYAEMASQVLGADDRRRLCTAVAKRLGPGDDVVSRLRVAVLTMQCDTPQPVDELVVAALEALRLGDMELGEQLARSALQRSDTVATRLPLANALAWQGRGREANEVLAAIDPATLPVAELMAWALPRAANQFWMLGEPARATAFLETIRKRVSAPVARATLDALAATFAMNAGTPLRALRLAEDVLESEFADEVAVGWAASAAALSSARVGRFGPVDALAARAVSGAQPGLLRFTSGFGRITALLMTGRLDEARSLAQRYTDFAELQQPGRAIGEVLVGYVAIAQGDFAAAVPLLERAADALTPTGYSWGPLALMLLAQALGQQGDRMGAAKVLSNAESRHGMKSAVFAPELALAKAWSKAARGDAVGALDAAREAVQAAERGGQAAIALRALQDAARLGDMRAVYRAQRLAGEVDCVVGRLTLAHAAALADGDADALKEVAEELSAIGMRPAAADAAAQAERLGN